MSPLLQSLRLRRYWPVSGFENSFTFLAAVKAESLFFSRSSTSATSSQIEAILFLEKKACPQASASRKTTSACSLLLVILRPAPIDAAAQPRPRDVRPNQQGGRVQSPPQSGRDIAPMNRGSRHSESQVELLSIAAARRPISRQTYQVMYDRKFITSTAAEVPRGIHLARCEVCISRHATAVRKDALHRQLRFPFFFISC